MWRDRMHFKTAPAEVVIIGIITGIAYVVGPILLFIQMLSGTINFLELVGLSMLIFVGVPIGLWVIYCIFAVMMLVLTKLVPRFKKLLSRLTRDTEG